MCVLQICIILIIIMVASRPTCSTAGKVISYGQFKAVNASILCKNQEMYRNQTCEIFSLFQCVEKIIQMHSDKCIVVFIPMWNVCLQNLKFLSEIISVILLK